MERERILIDTTILIDHLRQPQKDLTIFYQAALRFECVISTITEFEFMVGMTPKNRQFGEALLTKFPVLAFDSACVQRAAEIYRQLRPSNQPRPGTPPLSPAFPGSAGVRCFFIDFLRGSVIAVT